MSNISDEEVYALFFKVMANKDRLMIINSIVERAKTVSQICKDTGFDQTWVSHSLRLLRDRGMVEARRDGKYVYYRLDRDVKPVINTVVRIAPKYQPRTRGV